MLMNWSSPFLNEESSSIPIKNKIRPKLMNNRQLEHQDDDNELQDYMPKKGIEKLKEKKEKEKEKTDKMEKETFYQPLFEEQEYPIYDKPFESSKESQLLEKLNYMIYLLEEQKDEKTGQVTEELILYVFLGVFVLFVLDSFFKTGKYSR
jgi:hypothetical protein